MENEGYLKMYLQWTTIVVSMEVTPTELLAWHVYCPASVLFILSNLKNATLFPELFCTPFLIHATSGCGFPEASQAMVTEDPSL